MSIYVLNTLVPIVFSTMLLSVAWISGNRAELAVPIIILFACNITVTTLQKRKRFRKALWLSALRFLVSFPSLCWLAIAAWEVPCPWIFFLPHCFAISFTFLMPLRAVALCIWSGASLAFLAWLQGSLPGILPCAGLGLVSLLSWSGAWILERNLVLIQMLPEEDREKWGRSIGNQAMIAFTVLLAGIGLTLLLLRNELRHRHQENLSELRAQAETGIKNLNQRLYAQRSALETVAAFFEGSNRVEQGEFEIFTRRVLADHACIRAFAWIPQASGNGPIGHAPVQFLYPAGSYTLPWDSTAGYSPDMQAWLNGTFARGTYALWKPMDLPAEGIAGPQARIILAAIPVVKKNMRGLVVAFMNPDKLAQLAVLDPLPGYFSLDLVYQLDADRFPIFHSDRTDVKTLLQENTDIVGGGLFRAKIGVPADLLGNAPNTLDAMLLIMGIASSALLAYFLFQSRRASLPLEIKVMERTRELQRVVIRAEEASQSKSKFLAHMSHEICTPLNGVLGMSESLLHSGFGPAARESVELIKASGLSLLTILNDILDISKIESGKMRLEPMPFRIGPLMTEIFGIMKFDAETRGLALRMEIESVIPDWVLGDGLRVRQILINLLSNALKFTPRGSVSVYPAYFAPDRFRVRIVDSGIGIPESKLGRLFQPFEQGDSSLTRKSGGTGLGLVISLQLAKMMGGDIRVTSREGVGSEFILDLSLPQAQPPPATSEDAGPGMRKSGKGYKGGRMLLAEDNAMNVRVAKALMAEYFETIDVAANGAEALEKLAAGGYELILMDVQMPIMDGLQATREIRKQAKWADMPIIALSANVFPQDRENCLAAGMQDFLEKPITKAGLQRVLARYLKPERM